MGVTLLTASALNAGADDYPRYSIQAEVDVQRKTLTAAEEVTFTNTSQQNLSELYFHIYPNRRYTAHEKGILLRYGAYFKVNPFPTGYRENNFKIHSVTLGGQPLVFKIEGKDETVLKVELKDPLSPGQSVKINLSFSSDLPNAFSRFGWHDGVFKFSRWYPVLSVHNEEGWHTYPFYPFHRPFFTEASHYDVKLTVPQDQVVIHTGSLTAENSNGNGTKTLSLETSLPVREFTLAMSKDYQLKEGEFEGTKIKSFYLPGDEKMAEYAVEVTQSLMRYYSKYFGKYPYPEYSIAPVPLGNNGEQMSNLSFIDSRMYKLPGVLKRYFDFIVAHEAGHQWLYNIVGINEFKEMWLEEGTNSFFIQEYLIDKYGKGAEVLVYPDWFKPWNEWMLPKLTFEQIRDFRYKSIARIGYDHPVVSDLSSFAEPSSIFSIAYGKGAGVVAMLKNYLGEEIFHKVFKRIFAEFSYKNLSVKDFVRICEEESRRDLSEFFDQWLHSSKKLDYAITHVKGDEVTIKQKGDAHMPLQMKVTYSGGREKVYDMDIRERKEVFPLEDGAKITRLQLDPYDKLLDIDRTNDHWPRRVKFMPVPLYLGLHDMSIFMPEDSYNVVVGPELANNGFGLKASFQKPFDYYSYAATDYEFGEQLHHSRGGFQLNNVFHTQTTAGIEVKNTHDLDDGDDDLASGKLFLRRELWPVQYGLGDINDHVSLYLLRNRSINDGAQVISGREDGRNIDYSRRNESIVGLTLNLNRSGPYPDPVQGYRVSTLVENAGHFLGATQQFTREAVDLSGYQPVTPRTRVAGRIKVGMGQPDDKALFFIGGIDGLRGYERKSIRGANALLGSLEYRFPIKDNMKIYVLDNILGFESLGGVFFADAGQSWFGDFDESDLKKNAGFGLRVTVSVGSLLEKVIIRADVAQAINDSDEDPRFWLGLNHAF